MKIFLLYSASCFFITSIMFAQPGENSDDDIISDLSLPDSTLNNLLKCPDKPGSRVPGNLFLDSILVLQDKIINDSLINSSACGQYRIDNMPEYSFEGEYFPKMPEYHPDPEITDKMPEVKFPRLTRDKSKIMKHLKKQTWDNKPE